VIRLTETVVMVQFLCCLSVRFVVVCQLSHCHELLTVWSSLIRRTSWIAALHTMSAMARVRTAQLSRRLPVTWVISITQRTQSFWQHICTLNSAYLGVRQLLSRPVPRGTISMKWSSVRILSRIYDYICWRMKISSIVIGLTGPTRWMQQIAGCLLNNWT